MDIFKILLIVMLLFLRESKSTNLTDMAVNTAKEIYYKNTVTAVIWGHNNCDDVTLFLSKFPGLAYHAPLKNNENIRDTKIALNYRQVVLFITNSEEFETYLKLIYKVMIVAIQIILVSTIESIKPEDLMNIAWKYDVTDIFVLQIKENKGEIFTYFPYSNGLCGNTAPVLLNNYEDIKLALTKKFQNFQGCPIRFSLIFYEPYIKFDILDGAMESLAGLEAQVPFILSYILNASLEFLPTPLDVNVGSTTNSNFFLDILNDKSDIVVPSTILNLERYQMAQISLVYKYITIAWVGPPRRSIETWAKIVHSFFDNTVTPFLYPTFCIFVIITMLIKRFIIPKVKCRTDVLISSYSILLGQEAKFESKSTLLNNLFMTWIWFCMILRLVLQGVLTCDLGSTSLESPWTSMDYAITQVDGYGGGLMFKNMLNGIKFGNDFKVLNTYDESINVRTVAKGQRFILITDKTAVDLLMVGTNFQYIGPPMISIPSCWYMRPGWPAAKRINSLLQKIIEVGIIVKATKDDQHTNMLKLNIRNDRREVKNFQPLNLDDFKGFIYIYVILMCLCVVIFAIEILYYKVNRMYTNS